MSSSLIGIRVVRGPDWKWGDEDGGEGHIGTITGTSSRSRWNREVDVLWDSGLKGHYRAGPKGSYDLRAVDDPSGERHRNFLCGDPNCLSKSIRGMRWKCVNCEMNLCTSCFLKKKPHNKDHNRFQRFDNPQAINTPTVFSWKADRPETRIALMGIFPGAEVVKGPTWPYGREDEMEIGVVSSDLADKTGEIVVEWKSTREKSREERCSRGKLQFGTVIGGYYHPDCFPSVQIRDNEIQQSTLCKEIDEWIKKGARLFLKAVEEGDVESAQFLYSKDKLVVDARNADGRTALHFACLKGNKEMVQWLLDEVKMEIEKADEAGSRAIHHTVKACQPEVLDILIQRGAQLDVLNGDGISALHIAVIRQFTDCVTLLIQRGCDVNIRDSKGRILLHSTIMFGKIPEAVIQAITSSGRIDWSLKDRDGFNVLHLAVIKNDLQAIQHILENMDHDLLLETLPDTQCTVLHYACIHLNIKVVELLLGNKEAAGKLLESRNTSGMTALLIAVSQKNYALIELLISAGADLKAADDNGDTALILAASHPMRKDANPPKDLLSPSLLKIFKNHPELFFIGYLIEKGFCWTTSNSSGLKPADCLLNRGQSNEAIELLDCLASKMLISIRRSSGGKVCMGQENCIQPPEFQLTCPHKPTYKACSKCFVKCFEAAKCGCDNEDVASILPAAANHEVVHLFDDEQVEFKKEVVDEEVPDCSNVNVKQEEESDPESELLAAHYVIQWQQDGSKRGYCLDQMGNKYFYSGKRKDGCVLYRCTEVAADPAGGTGERCPAVACKIKEKIKLERPHKHSLPKKKKKKKSKSSSEDGVPTKKRKKKDQG